MNIGNKGVKLIKEFEGCYLTAYKCPANVWTIGYGTTEPINGVKIHQGMKITQKQADELLQKNLKTYENAVNKYTTYKLNQNQFDAMVSFTYNCGCGAYQKSDMLKFINKGDMNNAMKELLKWNKGGGKVLNGLIRRREAEKKLFLEPCEEVYDMKKIQIELDGRLVTVEAVEVEGHNYIKLRDLESDHIKIDFNKIPIVKVVK